MKAIWLLCAFFIASVPVKSADDEWEMDDWSSEESSSWFSGFVEFAGGNRLASDPAIDGQTTLGDLRLQVQWSKQFEYSSIELTSDFYYDGVLDNIESQLRELAWQTPLTLFGDWGEKFDVKIGQQVLTWGTGDYLFLNDLFPKDFQSFFAGRDDEYLKAPSTAIKLSGYFESINFDWVYSPEFDPDVYINGDYFSLFFPPVGQNLAPGFSVADENRPSDAEYALRLFQSVDTLEWAVYGYQGFFKSPNGFSEEFAPLFSPLNVYGASIRLPVGDGLFNAEYAFYDSTDDRQGVNPLLPNQQSRWLLGYEQELASDLTGSIQWYLENTHHYDNLQLNSLWPSIEVDEHRVVTTQRLTYRLMQQALTISLFNFYSTNDNDGYLKAKVAYSPSDDWRLTAGVNYFYGDRPETFFNQFQDASNLHVNFRVFY